MRYLFNLENEKSVLHGQWTVNVALVLLIIVFLLAAFAPTEPYFPPDPSLRHHVADSILPDVKP